MSKNLNKSIEELIKDILEFIGKYNASTNDFKVQQIGQKINDWLLSVKLDDCVFCGFPIESN